jgi:hypothetical protein
MKTHRKITPLIGFALTLSALVPASAGASSVLSGYGGPGQGTQAILGSTLLNGPSAGAGGGSAGGGPTATAPLGARGSGGTTGSGGNGHATGRHGSQTSATATGGGVYASYSRLGASQTSARGVGVLGLSDSAFLFALLALAALLFTGLLTRGLAKASGTRRHAGS